MISCKGLGTHQQVLFLTFTVLIGGVQHLEGPTSVVVLVVEEPNISMGLKRITDNFVEVDCPIL